MDLFGANPVDVVVLVIVLVSALLALVRGFVAEVLAILGWIAAFFAALYGMKPILPVVEGYMGPGMTAAGATAGGLFLGTLAVMSALSYAVSRTMRTHHLTAVDRSLGFLFGLGRGGLLVCLLYICLTFIFPLPKSGETVEPSTMQAVLLEARTQPMMATGAAVLQSLAPNQGLSVETLTQHTPLTDLIQPKLPTATSGDTTAHDPAPASYSRPARDDLANMINRVDNDEEPTNAQSPPDTPPPAPTTSSPAAP